MVAAATQVADEDPGAVFDLALESSRLRASTMPSRSSWLARQLQIRQEPKRRILPEKQREIAMADESLKAVLRELIRGQKPWPLFLHGDPGTGKSCAALAFCDHLHHPAVYTTAADLAAMYMDSWKADKKFDWSPYAPYRETVNQLAPMSPPKVTGSMLVVLDELGTRQNVSDTHYECIQRVMDMREGWPLIVVSNLNLAGIGDRYDDRIASRCSLGTVVKLHGKDRRLP